MFCYNNNRILNKRFEIFVFSPAPVSNRRKNHLMKKMNQHFFLFSLIIKCLNKGIFIDDFHIFHTFSNGMNSFVAATARSMPHIAIYLSPLHELRICML